MHDEEFRPEDFLTGLIARRARRLGISEDELSARAERAGPQYLAALRERAQRKRISLEEALNRDLVELRNSSYPGPDCLDPNEIETLAFGTAPNDEVSKHLATCPACRALVETVSSAGQGPDVFIDEMRRLLSQVSPGRNSPSQVQREAARK
jgi:hypothetical protein